MMASLAFNELILEKSKLTRETLEQCFAEDTKRCRRRPYSIFIIAFKQNLLSCRIVLMVAFKHP